MGPENGKACGPFAAPTISTRLFPARLPTQMLPEASTAMPVRAPVKEVSL
jgi:hypothetical protein